MNAHQFRYFSTIKLGQLKEDKLDRRGTVAQFIFKDEFQDKSKSFNWEYINAAGVNAVQSIIVPLGYELHAAQLGQAGEQSDCWICIQDPFTERPRSIVVDHKYWGPEKLQVFYKIVAALAPLYKWTIIDERTPAKAQIPAETPVAVS